MKRLCRRFLPFLFLAFIFSGCQACRGTISPKDSTDSRRASTLTYRLTSPPRSFNYLLLEDEASLIPAFYLTGGRLVEFDHEKQRYRPGVAESWERSADGCSFDLLLREGARFSDGHPLTADDVEFTFRALYDERTQSPAFRDAMLVDGQPIRVKVLDPRRVRLTFSQQIGAPESYLSNLAVLPRHTLENDFNRGQFRDAYGLGADPKTMVTAGPFVIEKVTPGVQIILRRNPNYWKHQGAVASGSSLEQIVIEIVTDANNAFLRLEQGSLDILDRIRPADFAALKAKPGVARAVDAGAGLGTDHVFFNLTPRAAPSKRVWFEDSRFRRAVSHGINRESIAKNILQGLATPLYSLVSPGNRIWFAKDLPRPDYDLDRARALLGEAGFRWRGSPESQECIDAKGNKVEFSLLVPSESGVRMSLAAVLKEDLAKLGIVVNIAPIEFKTMSARIFQSFDYDAALLGTSVTEPDPSSYVNLLRSSSPTHQWNPKQARPATDWEARIDRLLNEQSRESVFERRRDLFFEIQKILAEQSPVIPIVARHQLFGANQRVDPYNPSPILPYSLWNADELSVR